MRAQKCWGESADGSTLTQVGDDCLHILHPI